MPEALDDELEELLPQPRRAAPSAAAVLAVLIMAGLAVAVCGPSPLRRKSRGFLSLVLEPTEQVSPEDLQNCFEEGMYYNDSSSSTLLEHARTVEFSAERCQVRCQGVETCDLFTFWPDGGCLLAGASAHLKAAPEKFSTTITGPKYCQKALEKAKALMEEAKLERSGEDKGKWHARRYKALASHKSMMAEALERAKAANAAHAQQEDLPAPSAGVNGTLCAMYPACVAAGVIEEQCCPNVEHIMLGCCAGFPKVKKKKVAKVPPAANCSKFVGCRQLNISGACCPTASGENLGCCYSAAPNSSFWKTVDDKPPPNDPFWTTGRVKAPQAPLLEVEPVATLPPSRASPVIAAPTVLAPNASLAPSSA